MWAGRALTVPAYASCVAANVGAGRAALLLLLLPTSADPFGGRFCVACRLQ
jgi:hypothetical protein